jgi:ABC-type molybdate transport system substrate-binding protein
MEISIGMDISGSGSAASAVLAGAIVDDIISGYLMTDAGELITNE